jgi:hypothetical protein
MFREVFTRTAKLLFRIKSIKSFCENKKSPVELQALIDLPAPAEESAEIKPSQGVYELRRGRTLVKNIIPETKYETLTFKHFFPKLLNTFKNFDFSLRKDSFKTQVNLNLADLKLNWFWVMVLSFLNLFLFLAGLSFRSEFSRMKKVLLNFLIWKLCKIILITYILSFLIKFILISEDISKKLYLQPLLVTVKGSGKNDPK